MRPNDHFPRKILDEQNRMAHEKCLCPCSSTKKGKFCLQNQNQCYGNCSVKSTPLGSYPLGGGDVLQKVLWHPAHLKYMTIHRGVGGHILQKVLWHPAHLPQKLSRGVWGYVLQKALWHPYFVWTTKWPPSLQSLGAQTINGLHTINHFAFCMLRSATNIWTWSW